MKNFIKVIFYLYIILIMPFMIYMYSTNHSISSKMQNNDMLRAKISSLDQFKESIIDMAIMSKYYLITGDQYYKTEFEKNYNTASDNINDLYNSEYITISEKSNFLNNLNSYKEIAEDNSYIVNSDNIDPSLKKQIRNLTEIETGIIDNTSNALYSSIKLSDDNSGSTMTLVSSQNNILELLGGFFTMIFLLPLYFVNKNSNLFTGIIKNFISDHFKRKSKSPSVKNEPCNDAMLQCINDSIIQNLQEKINDRNMLVSTLRIIYSHSEFMEREWTEGKNILDSVEDDLSELRNDLNSLLNKSEIPYEKFNTIENKLLEVKFLLEKLPGYHDFIMKLTEPYKSNNSR